MVRSALTDQAIRGMLPPAKGYAILWDGSLKGFGCRISQAGTRAFVVLVASGRPATIGRYPALTLADARKEARRLLAERTLGRTKPKRAAFDDCRDEYLADCARRIRPSTVKLYRYHLERDFPFGRQALADISPRQIIKQLSTATPSMREHAERIGRTFFDWAIRNHYLDQSPMARITPAKRRISRSRVLHDEELQSILTTCAHLRTPYASIVELLLRTGQRRAQIAGLRWEWVDENKMLIRFPANVMKTGREHTIPISNKIIALIQSQAPLNEYVFPASRERVRGQPATTFAGFSKSKILFDRECRVSAWTLHDLRRTHAVILQRCHVRFEVIEAILGHVIPGVAGVYLRYDWLPEMREAADRLERFIDHLIDHESA